MPCDPHSVHFNRLSIKYKGGGVAYHPIIDIVKSNFDIVEGDGDLEVTEKLKQGLKMLKTDVPLSVIKICVYPSRYPDT